MTEQLSVLMLVYNGAKYVAAAIESVLPTTSALRMAAIC
jgi:hypothetical protein